MNYQVLALFLLIFTGVPLAAADKMPRTIIVISDESTDAILVPEMPLNHLGFKVQAYNLNQKFPESIDLDDVAGILTWISKPNDFPSNIEIARKWVLECLKKNKRVVIWDQPPWSLQGDESQKIWDKLGFVIQDNWVLETSKTEISFIDRSMMEFERRFEGVMPMYEKISISNEKAVPHLILLNNQDDRQSTVVFTTPWGGYASADYGFYIDGPHEAWYVNPFKFFRLAFGVADQPIPDTTTVAGKRIYFSQIDGDGWNNQSLVPLKTEEGPLSSSLFLHEIVQKYPELPVTVGPIAAEIDLGWFGTERSRQVAKNLFLQPNVEIGCHTFSHPYDWGFFNDYKPENEVPYLKYYPKRRGDSYVYPSQKMLDEGKEYITSHPKTIKQLIDPDFVTPRAFAVKPFDLNMEVLGAIKEVNELAPKAKEVEVYQWSGNALVPAKAIALTQQAGVYNINGPMFRLDNSYNSYAWLTANGTLVDHSKLQVYSSASNEIPFTSSWTNDFYGFALVVDTFKRTECPIRVKPINLYYHIFSAEKYPSLNAVQGNLEFIKTQDIIPIKTSQYCSIVEGFYSTQIEQTASRTWKIANRKGLQTFRFDNATLLCVDFSKSKGVIGQCRLQGSLYVFLDSEFQTPEITIKDSPQYYREPLEETAYLINSTWNVWGLDSTVTNQLSFKTQGYGQGKMVWQMTAPFQDVTLSIGDNEKSISLKADEYGKLKIELDDAMLTPIVIHIRMAP